MRYPSASLRPHPGRTSAILFAFCRAEEARRHRFGGERCIKSRKACASSRTSPIGIGVAPSSRRVTATCNTNSTALTRMCTSCIPYPCTTACPRAAPWRRETGEPSFLQLPSALSGCPGLGDQPLPTSPQEGSSWIDNNTQRRWKLFSQCSNANLAS